MNREQLEVFREIEERHWWFVTRRTTLRGLVSKAVEPGSKILDLGCGTGGNIAQFDDRYVRVGVDGSADAVEFARRLHPNVEFIVGDPFEVAQRHIAESDAILLTDVIEHVEDDFEFLSRTVREMKEGAQLIVTVPADMGLWSPHDEAVLHFRRYDMPRFERVWQSLPVKVRLKSAWNARLYPVVWAARQVARRLGTSLGRGRTDFSLPPGPLNLFLERIFTGESRALIDAVDRDFQPFRIGVSLIALLERVAGEAQIQKKPDDLAPDPFDPRSTANVVR